MTERCIDYAVSSMVCRSDVTLRSWRRSDYGRRAAWVAPTHTLAWSWFLPSATLGPIVPGPAWAVLVGSVVVGRLMLYDVDMVCKSSFFSIYISETYTSEGVGSTAIMLLIDCCIALGITCLFLDVAASNTRAIKCYHRLGFRLIALDKRSDVAYYIYSKVI